MPYWEIVSYTCGSVVCPLAIISIICAFCGRRCRKQEAREENVGCWKRIAKCCYKSFTCFHCFSFWKRKSVSRPTPESSAGLLESESGLREASALIVDESEHEDSEENVGCLERATRFCSSCFCCCQCLWKKGSLSLPIPESGEDVDRVSRGVVSTCSLMEESVETELISSAHGSRKERERVAEREGEEAVEGYHPSSTVEETLSSDSKLETSQKLEETGPVSADTSEVVPLLQPETTESKSKFALSKLSSTDKQQSKKVRPSEEDRRRKVGWKDTTGSEPPRNKSLKRNPTASTLPLDTESIGERSSNVPSNSEKSSAIHNTNKCHTVVEQNEAVEQVHLIDDNGNEDHLNVTQSSRHTESETKIACEPWTKFLPGSRKTDVKEVVRVQKIQKHWSSDEGYCSRQTSRQDSQQLGAEDSLHSVSSTDQTCLVNRQKSADSALGYVPESESGEN